MDNSVTPLSGSAPFQGLLMNLAGFGSFFPSPGWSVAPVIQDTETFH